MTDDQKSEEPQQELILPSWLDAAFVQQAVQHGGDNSRIKEFSAQPACKPGDNYGSAIFRIKVTLADDTERTLIAKLPPLCPEMADTIAKTGVFGTEMSMFGRILPEMQILLEAAAPGRFPPLAPRCFHHGSTPAEFLVLEDLGPQGFKVADRGKGLGLRHSIVAIRVLARFHAASAVLLERDPLVAKDLPNPFKSNNAVIELFITHGMKTAAAACRRWPGFEDYASIIENFGTVALEKYGDFNSPKPGAFNVILHGDCWTANMMFRYEDKEPQDVRLVDLQISHVAPAAVDLITFLNSSLSESVFFHYQDLLIREYHKALVTAMELLGAQPPSLNTILADIDSMGSYALYGGIIAYPVIKAKSVLPDFGAMLTGNSDFVNFLYQIPEVERWMQRVLPLYKQRGCLPS